MPPITGQLSNSFQVSLPLRSPFFSFGRSTRWNRSRLSPADHADVNAGFLCFQDVNRDLRGPLWRIEERFFFRRSPAPHIRNRRTSSCSLPASDESPTAASLHPPSRTQTRLSFLSDKPRHFLRVLMARMLKPLLHTIAS